MAGTLEAKPGAGNIETVELYHDFRLHAEFQLPPYPANSGIYLQRRYEVQIVSNYERIVSALNGMAAMYGFKDPTANASVPDGKWETFDILFRAARWSGATKTENARVTVYWNTVLVQDNVALTRPTGGGEAEAPTPGPIQLQAHTGPVRFRNVWVQGAIANPPALAVGRTRDGLFLTWPLVPSGFGLETTDMIGTLIGGAWRAVSQEPSPVGSQNVLQLPTPAVQGFFRLSRPD